MFKSPRTFGTILALLMTGLMTTAFLPGEKPEGYGKSGAADKTLSPYFVVLSDDPKVDALPLKSTRADVKIAGVVAEVKITQVYRNAGKKALEAIYVFPMSTRAAVHAMRMTIGERVVDAQIMERLKARETYETAKKEGKTTSLLEQQRPNVFQMNVANILPGDEIKVELKYMELLIPEDHVYEFVYPTVVGPRYTTKTAEGAVDNDKWVQNPYLHEGEAPPYTFGLNVELNSGVPIASLTSSSHEVSIKYSGKTSAQVSLKDEKTGGNKDFVLRYTLAGGQIETGLLLYPGQEENFFMLMMEPPARVKPKAVVPREYIFIVDISGSMHGFPLDTAKVLMKNVIKDLKPQDFLNVLLFASGSATLSPTGSLPASEANKEKALAFIQSRTGGGGTNIVPALNTALALPRTQGVSRIVSVVTDGYVDVEPQVFQLIRDNLGTANLFAFGIGTSVNRHLIEGMARAGMGEPFVVLNPGGAAKQAARFSQYIANPVLTDIKVAYEGFSASDVEPKALPDLFAMRPLTLLGKYQGSPTGAIVVRGKTAKGPYEQRLELKQAKAGPQNAALRLLWARQRIMNLVDFSRFDRNNQEMVKEVTALGLKYSLMTPYTSFVAVDHVKRADGQVVTVKQPLPLPEGVSDLAVGGGGTKRMAMMPSMMPASPSSLMAKDESVGFMGGGRKPKSGSHAGGTGTAELAVPPVSVTVKDVKVTAGLTPAAVQKALEGEVVKLTQCCQDAAKAGLKLPAELMVTFSIGLDGKIAGSPKLALSQADKSLESCLAAVFKGIQFPQPQKAAVAVTITLSLAGK
jgi:Ca-activated chloride channel family protein